MKKLLNILIFSYCFILNSQNNLEIKGIIVDNQNSPIEYASVSIPSAFLRTATCPQGKFNLSLANMDYETDDLIEISYKDSNETIEMTIEDYIKLNRKVFVINHGNVELPKSKKTITTTAIEPVQYSEAKKTTLTFNNVKKGNKISIKNNKGKLFFKELIETSELKKKEFDLNYLADGNYFFEIEKDSQINIKPFTLSYENGIIYSKHKETTLNKPHIKVENEMVLLTQVSEYGEPVTIDIYDENGVLLYNDTTENELDIQRAFKLKKGNFKFVITANNKEYATLINNYD